MIVHLLCIFLIGIALPATAAHASDPLRPKSGGTLRVPLSGDISSLDPARCYELPGELFVRAIYQGLVDFGEGAAVVPALAKSWTVSSNGLQYMFELDSRARFSNGRPVVAGDYIFTFERTLSPKMHCPADFLYLGIQGVDDYKSGKAPRISGLEAPSSDRLLITLTKPDLTFLFRVALPFAAPICSELLTERFREMGTTSAGAGPFRLERWIRGATIKLARNSHYGGSLPAYLDGVLGTIGVQESVAQMMFERGEVEIADLKFGIAGSEFARILRTPSFTQNLETEPSSAITYLVLNNEIPPFNDKRVGRQ